MSNGPFGPPNQYGPRDEYGPQDAVPGRGPLPGRDDGGYGDPRLGRPQERMESRGGRFSAFPFPNYSTRTRNGTQVSVGGCCLPLPIGCLMTTLAAGGVVVARLARARR